jgi:hypothetical protein
MKRDLKLKTPFLANFRESPQRNRHAGLALTACVLGLLPPARGQDPWLTDTAHPVDTSVSLGGSVTLQAYATTAYDPLIYQWQHSGTNLPGAKSSFLELNNLTVAHAGGYAAWITNAIGGFTNTRTAILTVDPTFTQVMAAGDLLTDTTGAWNACWVDYDGDGYLDVSVSIGEYLAVTPLYHNEGNGEFTKVTTNAIGQTEVWTFAHVWADYDNDGRLDMFVPNIGTMNDVLFHNDGNGAFTCITTGHPAVDGSDSMRGVWGDYDRDGFLDLFVTTGGYPAGQNDNLYRNNGDGSFRKMTAAEVGPFINNQDVNELTVWVDVDNDGWPELYRNVMAPLTSYPDWSWTNEVYHLDGDGKFYLMDIGEMKKGTVGYTDIAWADYDNDGFLDGLVWAEQGLLGLYRNLAGQGFTNVAASAFPSPLTNSWATWIDDYDNDGWQDLVVGSFASEPIPLALFRNNGDGTFTSKNLGGPTSVLGWQVWGDYNNDGFLDVLMPSDLGLPHTLFRHNGNTNHWLNVKLDGRASNRDGIGAKVRINATIGSTNFWQMREISGQGRGLENGLRCHFGLGDATNVTTLRIEWPSGIVQELPNVPANRFLTVVESQGYLGAAPQLDVVTNAPSGLQLSITEPLAPARYILEASADLVEWTKLMARTSAGVTTNYTDTRATNYTRRFYRLQVP